MKLKQSIDYDDFVEWAEEVIMDHKNGEISDEMNRKMYGIMLCVILDFIETYEKLVKAKGTYKENMGNDKFLKCFDFIVSKFIANFCRVIFGEIINNEKEGNYIWNLKFLENYNLKYKKTLKIDPKYKFTRLDLVKKYKNTDDDYMIDDFIKDLLLKK